MLSKLIGYEFKATRRIFLPAYAVVLILSLLNGIFMVLPSNRENITMPFGVLITVYILALFAVCVLTFAYMISRFYKNLLGDEGYLMFTLPARPSELIWAKCITSTLWMMFTAIVCCVSFLILSIPIVAVQDFHFFEFLNQFGHVMQQLWGDFSVHIILLPLAYVLIGIIWTENFCMHIYACLSIGSLANKHRLGFSFLAYLGFGILSEILLMIFASVSNHMPELNLNLTSFSAVSQVYLTLLLIAVYYLIKLAINFVITNYILSKHLNLQ